MKEKTDNQEEEEDKIIKPVRKPRLNSKFDGSGAKKQWQKKLEEKSFKE